jgi:hypothetical protein
MLDRFGVSEAYINARKMSRCMKAADPSSDGIQCMGHILFWYRKVLLFWAINPAEASKVLGETLVSRFDPPPVSSGS